MKQIKFTLEEHELPTHFINISYYLNRYLGRLPDPPLHPTTRALITPNDLAPLFPRALIEQEVSLEEKIEIPDEVRQLLAHYRPTRLFRAISLEKFLDTPAHIYYKYEGESPAGSHKMNTALVQAYYNKKEGVKTLTTETGAGQWGTSLAIACNIFGLKCTVFMVKTSFENKPYRKTMMKLYGADVVASPSNTTTIGKQLSSENPSTAGSLGMAIAEAVEVAASHEDTKYALGSVLNHVLLHQTIIGQEAKKQMEKAGEYPDIVIGCCGGGSNFPGLAYPFFIDTLTGTHTGTRFIGIEPENCPSMTKGQYRYDYGDTGGLTPLLKMETLGHEFMPKAIHAGGLRYHGIAPQLAFLHHEGFFEARAFGQREVFAAAVTFAKNEGIIPAPESAHAIKGAIDEALECRERGEKKVILFNLSGHGLLDLKGYEDYLDGNLT